MVCPTVIFKLRACILYDRVSPRKEINKIIPCYEDDVFSYFLVRFQVCSIKGSVPFWCQNLLSVLGYIYTYVEIIERTTILRSRDVWCGKANMTAH